MHPTHAGNPASPTAHKTRSRRKLERRSLPRNLRLFLRASVLLTAICGVIEVFCKVILHLHYPYNFPMLNPGAITQDLLSNRVHFAHLHHLEFFDLAQDNTFTYPAPMALPYAVFFLVPVRARPLFYLACAMVASAAAVLLGRALIAKGLAPRPVAGFLTLSVVLSYPFWLELKQGNMEIAVFALIAIGVWCFLRRRGWTSATCFGIAASMKFFPVVFLGLFVSRKEYGKAAFALITGGLTTLLSLWLIYPSIPYTWHRINSGVQNFRTSNVLNRSDELGFDHSMWSLIKRLLPESLTAAQLSPILSRYMLTIAIAGLCLYFFRIRRLPVVNQVLCLTTFALLVTPMSFDYTLIHLYTPWALLILLSAEPAKESTPGLRPAFICLVLLCSPLSEFIHHGVTFEAQIKDLLLIALLLIGLVYPFPLPQEFDAGSSVDQSQSARTQSPLGKSSPL